jgi:hypothetical protein
MKGIMNILLLGAVGGIIFTAVTHPDGVKAAFGGLDSLYKTSIAGTLGQVA